ncbi:MAG: response regulator receiver protein [Propionibacteriaceae bacterium]|jgi:ATP/maltotriose-dependent transcriptional regulator MalT|nr:response regulator receiver protein [Propionibacteriaceae bacterium]
MADGATHLGQARDLHAQSRWADACEQFAAADRSGPLHADDLERYAEAAQILGRGDEAIQLLRRAFNSRIAAGERDRAITSAFWLFQALIVNAEFSRASGWAAQVRRSIPDVNHGWLLFTQAYFLIASAEFDQAAQLLARAAEDGSRRGETDLLAFATTVWGRALIKAGRLPEGLSRLDEAMVPVAELKTSPRATSMLYCSAIATCHEAREFGRAREWTHALGAWLDSLPRLGGAYFGNCRIYRAYLMCLRGSWQEALEEVAFVCDDLSGDYGQLVAGHAHYRLAEIHRLLGNPEAEAGYRRAAELGGPTQPGLSLLRLTQGEVDKAVLGIRRALAETPAQLDRLDLLTAAVTIMLAAGDIDSARQATAELAGIAAVYPTAGVQAELAAARGAVALSEGDPAAALPLLRSASRGWREIDVPHAVATVSVLLGLACRAVGDEDAAQLELESARSTFVRLGARPDLQRAEELLRPAEVPGPLSAREIEVLRLVAVGKTNHAIATELFVSERTVHRHVSNIFDKLGVRSRAAAASYAIQHHLVDVGIL